MQHKNDFTKILQTHFWRLWQQKNLPCKTPSYIVDVFCLIIPLIYIMQSFDFYCFFTLVFWGAKFLIKKFFVHAFAEFYGNKFMDETLFFSINFDIFLKFFSVCWAKLPSWFYLLKCRIWRCDYTKSYLHIAVELCFSHYHIWLSMSIVKFHLSDM